MLCKCVSRNFIELISIVNFMFLHCKFLILIMRKKNTQNDHIIAHFEYFFTCHYSKTIWLAENLNKIKLLIMRKSFLISSRNVLILRKGWETWCKENIFFVSLRLPLFSPRYVALKLNQKIITKYLTI